MLLYIAENIVGVFRGFIKSAGERLKVLMRDLDSKVRKAVVINVRGLEGEVAIEILNTLKNDSDSEVRAVVAWNAGIIRDKKEEVIKILNTLKNDPELEVKERRYNRCCKIGGILS